jgi:hypothetical protein
MAQYIGGMKSLSQIKTTIDPENLVLGAHTNICRGIPGIV